MNEPGPDLLKVGPIVFDVLVAGLLYGLVRRWTAERADSIRLGLLAAALYLFNPVTWYDSAVWGQTDTVGVFVMPPSFEVLEQRLRGRSKDTEAAMQRRLQTARDEVAAFSEYDYVIVNDELEACVDRLRAIVLAERTRLRSARVEAETIVNTFRAKD